MTNTKLSTIKDLRSILDSDFMKNKLAEIVKENSATFATSIIQIASQNDMLSKAEPNSIIGAALTAAALNLPLNNSIGHAYIVPFNAKQKDGTWTTKAQFILGYKGLKQLATRSGKFKFMNTSDVRQGEISFYDRLSGKIDFEWEQDLQKRELKKVIGYVSYFELVNGFKSFLYMSVEDLNKHGKKFSQTFKKGFGLWKDDFDKMCRKTVSKLHLNNGEAPLSIEMQKGIETDQSVISYENETEDVSHIDNEPDVEIDHDAERILLLINSATNEEELDFAKSHANEEHIDLIKKKQKELNKTKK